MTTGGHYSTAPCCLLIASHDLFALQFLWGQMLWNPSTDGSIWASYMLAIFS